MDHQIKLDANQLSIEPALRLPAEMQHVLSSSTTITQSNDDDDIAVNSNNYKNRLNAFSSSSSMSTTILCNTHTGTSASLASGSGSSATTQSTDCGPSSFPDLSYNQFQRPLKSIKSSKSSHYTDSKSHHLQMSSVSDNNDDNDEPPPFKFKISSIMVPNHPSKYNPRKLSLSLSTTITAISSLDNDYKSNKSDKSDQKLSIHSSKISRRKSKNSSKNRSKYVHRHNHSKYALKRLTLTDINSDNTSTSDDNDIPVYITDNKQYLQLSSNNLNAVSYNTPTFSATTPTSISHQQQQQHVQNSCTNNIDDDDAVTYTSSHIANNNNNNICYSGGYNEIELTEAINKFFNVIDSTGIGAVNFNILKICLKLLGINLNPFQLDILLNELTDFKPSLQISQNMLIKFLILKNGTATATATSTATDSLQVTLIRTEIIVALLSNTNHSIYNNNNSNNNNKYNSNKNKKRKYNKSDGNILKIEDNKFKYRKPPQIRRYTPSPRIKQKTKTKTKIKIKTKTVNNNNKLNLIKLTPATSTTSLATSANLPPLPPTPSFKANNNYNNWLLSCFKNSIIDSLIELLCNNKLREYIFDFSIISHYILINNILSVCEYLFECQFSFMSSGSAYLDYAGFISATKKCNIHFENPKRAIPIIFAQLVGIPIKQNTFNNNNNNNIDYNHLFCAEDTFVEWMMNFIKNSKKRNKINKLIQKIQNIYNKNIKNIKNNNNNNSKISNPFEIESLYPQSSISGSTSSISSTKSSSTSKHNKKYKKSIKPLRNINHNHNNSNILYTHKPYKNRPNNFYNNHMRY